MIRRAEAKDLKRLELFLGEANIVADGLEDYIDYYSLLETESGNLRACIGIEPIGKIGLVRSFVVSPSTTQVQIMMLFDRVIRIAEGKQLSSIYLATNKEAAASFFEKIGYQHVDRIPAELEGNPHFKRVSTVDKAVVMEMKVENVDN